MTADAALAAGAVSGDGHSAKEDAEDFLREVLADGAVGAKEVKRQAGEAGIANRTLMRAKRDLGVQSYREEAVDKHKWFWILPKDANPIIQECHVKKVGTLGTLGTLDPSDPSQGCQDFWQKTVKDAKDANIWHGHPCEPDGTLGEPDDDYPELPACLDRRVR